MRRVAEVAVPARVEHDREYFICCHCAAIFRSGVRPQKRAAWFPAKCPLSRILNIP